MLQENNNNNTNNRQAKSPATMPDADGGEIRLLHRNIWHTGCNLPGWAFLKNECSCEADISPTFSILGITRACCGIPLEVDIPTAAFDIFTKRTNLLNQEAQHLKINAILSKEEINLYLQHL